MTDQALISDEEALSLCRSYLGIDAKSPVQPRPYQARAIISILVEFEEGKRSTLLVLPTGAGKTVVFMLVAKYVVEKMGGRVLVLAHRGELITQAANAAAVVGLAPAIEKADEHARPDLTLGSKPQPRTLFASDDEVDFGTDESDPKLVIASVQTMQRDRLRAWPAGHFDLVICDEAHHAAADSYRAIIGHLAPTMYLGVTATWDRSDEEAIVGTGQVFESLAYEYTITDAVEDGYLARPWVEVLDCGVDLSKIRTTGGDLNAGDLEAAIRPHVEELVNAARPKLVGRRFICFTPDVGSADAVASAFRCLGVSCESVSGKCTDRDEVIAAFKDGRYQGLVNCNLLTEGFDAPFVDAVVMMRPTKSRSLYTQMAGRGTRLYPEKKDCLILAFNWQTVGHKLVRPVELFHTESIPAEVQEIANGLVESGECPDLLLAMTRAKEEVKKRERLRIEVEERKRNIRSVKFDPLAFDPDFAPAAVQAGADHLNAKASEKQLAALERMGFKPAEVREWSKARASGVLTAMSRRREQGLASYKQVQLLKKLGHPDATKIKFDEASAEIDRILKAKRPA